eukprot:sb/3472487/
MKMQRLFLCLCFCLLEVSLANRCYRCREVTFKVGDKQLFKQHERGLKRLGYLVPCTESSYQDIEEATCRERVYTSDEFCFGKAKGQCLMDVKERYPITEDKAAYDSFTAELFRPLRVKLDRKCQARVLYIFFPCPGGCRRHQPGCLFALQKGIAGLGFESDILVY